MGPSGPSPPPGWYPSSYGRLQWWDGRTWGPLAPDTGGSNRTLAVLSHLGMFAGGFILPLVVYLTEGRRDAYVRHHARESLNFQISLMFFWVGAFLVIMVTGLLSAALFSAPWPWVALFPLAFIGMFAAMALSIYGAVKAWQGGLWRYPLSIRLVRD